MKIVARLYRANGYTRASVKKGPGESLVLLSEAESLLSEKDKRISELEHLVKQQREIDAGIVFTTMLDAAREDADDIGATGWLAVAEISIRAAKALGE